MRTREHRKLCICNRKIHTFNFLFSLDVTRNQRRKLRLQEAQVGEMEMADVLVQKDILFFKVLEYLQG